MGQVIEVDVLLTTSHAGHFEFRIGAFDDSKTKGDRIGKLQGHLMELVSNNKHSKVSRFSKRRG